MLDEKDLQAIAALMDSKLNSITKRLDTLETKADKLQSDMDELKEEAEVTRGALNHLLEWSDRVSNAAGFPLPKS